MVQPRSTSHAQLVAEGATPAVAYEIENTAERITRSQYEKAKALLEASKEASPEILIEGICVLMAESFREGIHLTLETYGLKEPGKSTAA